MVDEKDRGESAGNKISPEEWKKIDEIIEKYKFKEGTLIPVLKETQELIGYLPLVSTTLYCGRPSPPPNVKYMA